MSFYSLLRPAFFSIDPEAAHKSSLRALNLLGQLPSVGKLIHGFQTPRKPKPTNLLGLTFPNKVGLAAGYDKDGLAWRGLSYTGFGHVEIGTITPKAQLGNPKPRVFRLPEDQGIINRLGFPGHGLDAIEKRLAPQRPQNTVLGINIGKNKDTPLEEAIQDYRLLLQRLSHHADYLVVNISSPNTPGLRKLQHKDYLNGLLKDLQQERSTLKNRPPLLVKLSPDLEPHQFEDAIDAILANDIDGIVVSNTTVSRDGLHSPNRHQKGGLSGRPLTQLSTQAVATVSKLTAHKIPIIGVGGIMSVDDAKAKLDAGASLVQIYTGMIYKGPKLVRELACL